MIWRTLKRQSDPKYLLRNLLCWMKFPSWHSTFWVMDAVTKGIALGNEVSHSAVSDSLRPHVLYLACQVFCPWDLPGRNTEVGCISFSSGSSLPRDQTQVSWISGKIFTVWATREAQGNIQITMNKLMSLLFISYQREELW